MEDLDICGSNDVTIELHIVLYFTCQSCGAEELGALTRWLQFCHTFSPP